MRTRLLDNVVRYRFGDNAELMGAWESARNVAGSFQTKNESQSGAGGSETLREAQGRPPKDERRGAVAWLAAAPCCIRIDNPGASFRPLDVISVLT